MYSSLFPMVHIQSLDFLHWASTCKPPLPKHDNLKWSRCFKMDQQSFFWEIWDGSKLKPSKSYTKENVISNNLPQWAGFYYINLFSLIRSPDRMKVCSLLQSTLQLHVVAMSYKSDSIVSVVKSWQKHKPIILKSVYVQTILVRPTLLRNLLKHSSSASISTHMNSEITFLTGKLLWNLSSVVEISYMDTLTGNAVILTIPLFLYTNGSLRFLNLSAIICSMPVW